MDSALLVRAAEGHRLHPELLERFLADDDRDRFTHAVGELSRVLVGDEADLDRDEARSGHHACPVPAREVAQGQVRSAGTSGIAANRRSRTLSMFSPKTLSTSSCVTGGMSSTPTS